MRVKVIRGEKRIILIRELGDKLSNKKINKVSSLVLDERKTEEKKKTLSKIIFNVVTALRQKPSDPAKKLHCCIFIIKI